jgi:hypothetical protein
MDQARVDGIIASYAVKNNMGLNVWGWYNNSQCGDSSNDQFALTNAGGTPRQAVGILQKIFSGQSQDSWLMTPVPDKYTPVGQIDSVDNSGQVLGWAYDPDASSLSIHVAFYLDGTAGNGGTQIADINANTSRPDVNSQVSITGNHGFVWSIPQQYKDGKQHTLYAYGRDTSYNGTRNALLNGAKTFGFNADGTVLVITAKDPTGFGGSINSQTCGKVDLYWFRNGAGSFNLYRSTTNNSATAQKIISNQAYTDPTYGGYSDLSVPAGTYYYWVENVNGSTRVPLYNNDKGGLILSSCSAAPAQDPTGFGGQIDPQICGRIDIWWFRNSAGAYNIYRNTNNDLTSAQKIVSSLAYTDPTNGGYVDVNLSPGTYYYWVENVGGSGNKVSLYNNSQGGLAIVACH